ncbi:MAG: radical SAM protein [Chloroflexi bacterium]|nr:radical SAM protein [Chloroflexota bacterium]
MLPSTLETKPRVFYKTKEKRTLIPQDCTLLPISHGALLVSRNHAVFCRIPPSEVDTVRAVVLGEAFLNALSQTTLNNLEEHGFFAPPRQPKPDSPTIQLQLTNDCNLACSYCCTNSGEARTEEVCFDQMLQVVRQIPEVLGSRTSIALLGGEPLLVPWAIDLASEIVRLGLTLTIFTNGIPLADDDLAEKTARLVNQGVRVRISLGGPSTETCDTISGASRFDAALRGIHNLAAFGGHATVDLMFTPQHADTISCELDHLRQRLPPNTNVTLGVLYLSGRETGDHLFKSRAELDAALDSVAFEAGVAISASRTSPVTHRREGCGCALGQHVHVRSDGALFNCFKMEEKVGHLDTIGFAAAARSIRENPYRASDLPICADCPLATLCGGGCRSENLLYTGNPGEPPCGPWRVRVLSELLAEDRVTAVEWSVAFLLQEARARGIETPNDLHPQGTSRHLIDV